MNRARWYSSSTVLMNGEIYIQGGSGGGDRPEVRQLNGNFRLLCNVEYVLVRSNLSAQFSCARRPRIRLRHQRRDVLREPGGTGQLTTAGQFLRRMSGGPPRRDVPPGKILQMGGNSNGAIVIDITGAQPLRGQPADGHAAPMGLGDGDRRRPGPRHGRQRSGNELTGVNNTAAVWNPATAPGRSVPTARARACITRARCCSRLPACS